MTPITHFDRDGFYRWRGLRSGRTGRARVKLDPPRIQWLPPLPRPREPLTWFSDRKRRFSQEDLQFMRDFYPTLPTRKVAQLMGRTEKTISVQACYMRLRKDDVAGYPQELRDAIQAHARLVRHISDRQEAL